MPERSLSAAPITASIRAARASAWKAPTPYLRDLPKAELHLLDTGHFALEEDGEQIARLMRDFLGRQVRR